MRPSSGLLKDIRSKKRIESAWRTIQENGRSSASDDVRREIEEFAKDATKNINSLSSRLGSGSFSFRAAKGIPIPKVGPDGKRNSVKFRPIVLAPVESRIVQRAILDTLLTVPDLLPYAQNEFSFGGIRKVAGQLAAVPAAIEAVLKAIGEGGSYVAFADIRSFFTRISKSEVSSIVAEATKDREFTEFFDQAVRVELHNLSDLKDKAKDFPLYDIGVAQGNCLSPLLGNLVLHDFDRVMNEGDCRCFRYIDDFIIVAPTEKAARARLRKAIGILKTLGMELSPEKSSRDPLPVSAQFDFLGIEFADGLIRPAKKKRILLEENIKKQLSSSLHAMRTLSAGNELERVHSFTSTLRRIDGIITGWAKHYRFCNDFHLLTHLDKRLRQAIDNYISEFGKIYRINNSSDAMTLLGIQELEKVVLRPLKWPQKSVKE